MPPHKPRKENNSVNNCNCRFQTEMATKRPNVWTAALNIWAFLIIHSTLWIMNIYYFNFFIGSSNTILPCSYFTQILGCKPWSIWYECQILYLHNVYIYIYIQCHFLFYIYNRFFYVTYKQPSPNFQVQKLYLSKHLSDPWQWQQWRLHCWCCNLF